MGDPEPRAMVPLTPFCQEALSKLTERYGITRIRICRMALEAGLRQISVPSGPPAGVSLPVVDGF